MKVMMSIGLNFELRLKIRSHFICRIVFFLFLVSSTYYTSVKDQSSIYVESVYYKHVYGIWKLDYSSSTIGLFKGKWVDRNLRCVKNNDLSGFTLVYLSPLLVVRNHLYLPHTKATQVYSISKTLLLKNVLF